MTEITLLSQLILKRKKTFLCLLFIIGFVSWLIRPIDFIFPEDYSTLIFDTNGHLLRATLASDQQYRFPSDNADLSEKYVTALLTFEDKRFFSHPGIDPMALAHATFTNLKSGKRVRGGSTIQMQIARLAQPKKRTYLNKLYECLIALKLSLHFSKEEILKLYSAHVPMGGNLVGIQAASYRYFGKPVTELTWAEATLFAVLPNSPAMINLERQRPYLIQKRNGLLKKMLGKQIIDTVTFEMACQEPLPDANQNLPFISPHFTHFVKNKNDTDKIRTTLDKNIQAQVKEAARLHHNHLADQGIANLAVIVAETQTGKVRAYLGSHDYLDSRNGGQVDGVQAFRSTGSLLKPFLVAKALDRGPYTMSSKLQDVPTFYGTFAPQNSSKEFSGLVDLEQVLIRSLNVPSVRLLNAYSVGDFYDLLIQGGLEGLFRTPEGYGLSLILGGAEASLFELVQLYLTLANSGGLRTLATIEADEVEPTRNSETKLFSEGAAWLVLNVLSDLSRPGIDFYWHHFDNQIPVAWKTGTSYGQKDGWAIGVNQQWTIGVWTGNFTGEGNAALSGAQSAAPLLFDLFNQLTEPDQPMWFEEPEYDLKEVIACIESGYPAGTHCLETQTLKIPFVSHIPGTCPFHRRYLIDIATSNSVCSICWQGMETSWVNRYIVPPSVKEILLTSGHPVDSIPRHAAHCPNFYDEDRLELVYPVNGIKIFIPRDFDGKYEKVVFSAKHQQPATHLFWFLNGSLIGETVENHRFPVGLNPGAYKLTVQDEEGFVRSISFTAYKKES